MNCEDYERAIGAEPGGTIEGGDAHIATCASCRALRDEYLELDRRIRQALMVSVPEYSLPDMNRDAKVRTLRQKPRVTAPAWFGLAATVALAAWLGLQLQRPDLDSLTLADQIVAHMDHEPASRVISDVAVAERTLDSVVTKNVAELGSGMGLITYARSCVINGKLVPHLVIQGENGPVTLLLMPDEPIDAVTPLNGHAINGVILPHGGGSIAIIGENDTSLGEIEERVLNAVKWKI